MIKLFSIALGGAIGALLRYGTIEWIRSDHWFAGGFPYGTLIVNLIGSFFIGLLWGIFQSGDFSLNLRAFIFIGVLSSFTTFSSFSMDVMQLFKLGQIRDGVIYVLSSNVLGVLLAMCGFFLASLLTSFSVK